jgi:hypothetical protein
MRNNCPPSIPNDDAILAQWAGLRTNSWPGRKARILALWHLGDDGRWHHYGLDDDYAGVVGNIGGTSGAHDRNMSGATHEHGREFGGANPLKTNNPAGGVEVDIDVKNSRGEESPTLTDSENLIWKDPHSMTWQQTKDWERAQRMHNWQTVQKLSLNIGASREAEGFGSGPIIDAEPLPIAQSALPVPKVTVFAWRNPEAMSHAGQLFEKAPPRSLLPDTQFEKFAKFNGAKLATHEQWKEWWNSWCERAVQRARQDAGYAA